MDGSIGSIKTDVDGQRKERGLLADEYPNEHNHIAIFECQMKIPPMLSLANHSHKEFLMGTTLNFRNWRLVDVDNYMQGNKPFTSPGDEAEQEEWQKKY